MLPPASLRKVIVSKAPSGRCHASPFA